MRPREQSIGQDGLFPSRLDQIIDTQVGAARRADRAGETNIERWRVYLSDTALTLAEHVGQTFTAACKPQVQMSRSCKVEMSPFC